MILIFKYGFEFNGFLFGWNSKELYRLPSVSGVKHYGLKKLPQITVGNKIGYRIKREKFTIDQLKYKTQLIKPIEINILKDKDLPF